MIFELLTEIRPLSGHNRVYDSYLHANETMALLSRRRIAINNKVLVLTGLLHEVEEKLGEYKLQKCLEIIDKHYPIQEGQTDSIRWHVATLLSFYKKNEKQSRYDWAVNLLQNHSSEFEELLLADLFSEARLTRSNTIRNGIKNIVTELVKRKLLNADDERVIDILNLNDTLITVNA